MSAPRPTSANRLSRARARSLESKREPLVREAMAMMAAGTFVVGKTAKELAAKWGMAVSSVHTITSEAWRRHGAEIVDPQRIKVKLVDVLETVIDEAMVETREPALVVSVGPDGEQKAYPESPNFARRVVVDAAKTLGALVGTQESSVPRGWEDMPLEERWAAVDRAQAKIDAVRATLPPREVAQLGEAETSDE